VIRALVDGLAESDLDLTSALSEKELTKAVTERLRRSSAAQGRATAIG
jgi:hypothetical protein